MSMYNVVFMGTPDFAVPTLDMLINDPRFSVSLVLTQEPKKFGRKQILQDSPVAMKAKDENIKVLTPTSLKNEEICNDIVAAKPDFIVVVAYGKIIPKNILDIPTYKCVNLHGSILPKHRGASPVQEALLSGDSEIGITIMLMNEKMDEGEMLEIYKRPVHKEDTAGILYHELYQKGAEMIPDILERLAKGEITPKPQDHDKATFCKKLERAKGQIDWNNETAEEIYRKWQAYTPWPGIFTFSDSKRLKLLEIDVDPTDASLIPGDVVDDKIGTKQGSVIMKKIQMEGKSAQDISEFLKGNSLDSVEFIAQST